MCKLSNMIVFSKRQIGGHLPRKSPGYAYLFTCLSSSFPDGGDYSHSGADYGTSHSRLFIAFDTLTFLTMAVFKKRYFVLPQALVKWYNKRQFDEGKPSTVYLLIARGPEQREKKFFQYLQYTTRVETIERKNPSIMSSKSKNPAPIWKKYYRVQRRVEWTDFERRHSHLKTLSEDTEERGKSKHKKTISNVNAILKNNETKEESIFFYRKYG